MEKLAPSMNHTSGIQSGHSVDNPMKMVNASRILRPALLSFITYANLSRVYFRRLQFLTTLFFAALIPACSTSPEIPASSQVHDSQDLYVVDCLLPGQIRQLGQHMTYLTPRRPIKTTAANCGIRGGEYVAYDRANYSTALSIWLPQAKDNKPEAQTYVGEIYEKGYGLQPDYKLAAHWYQKAAEQDYSRAQINLGYLYEQGLGVDKDLVTALNWYRKASGLENEDLAFASTIEAAVKSEYEEELSILRSELSFSHSEIDKLRKQVRNSKNQLHREKTRLRQLQNELDTTRNKRNSIKILPPSSGGSNKSQQYANELLIREAKVTEQILAVQKLEDNLKKQNAQFETQLTQAESRTARLNQELEQHQQEKGLLKEQLLTLQTQLNASENSLTQLNEDYNLEQQRINEEKNRLTLMKDEMQKTHLVDQDDIKSQLTEQEKELSNQLDQISTLEAEKKRLEQEKKLLESNLNSTVSGKNTAMEKLTDQLSRQETELEKQLAKINQLELEKVEISKNSAQMSADALTRANQQIVQRDKELAERLAVIDRLEKEKAEMLNDKKSLESVQEKSLSEKNTALDKLESQLEKQNSEIENQKMLISQLEKENTELNELGDQSRKQKDNTLLQKDADIEDLEEQLTQREKDNEKQHQQILILEKEKQNYENEIRNIQQSSAEQASYSPPTIEILEPPVSLTRGIPSVKLRSIMSHREVTGRVTAPAGLLSFNINGVKEKVNDSGMFKSMVEIKNKENRVKTVAIDQSGNKTMLEFMLLAAGNKAGSSKSGKNNKSSKGRLAHGVDFGPFHALIIGNQEYDHLPTLDTPLNDAVEVEKILKNKYGFKTTLIMNANRYDILSALNKLREKLTEVDNLLIYYAGHGELDRVNLRGHWLPVDAEPDNTANWISTLAITDILNAMSVRHVLVVADSCYSGAMTRSSLARLEPGMSPELRTKWLKVMSKTRSRTVLTSGGLKPVLDSGLNGHSIFANAFLESLNKNNQILEGQKLYRMVSDRLQKATKRLNFKQKPEYAPIRHGGHESGDFFFVAK